MLKIDVTKSKLNDKIIETYHHDIGTLYFFKNLVISEINEGEHVDFESATLLVEAINIFYEDISFGYISNRINAFSVTPLNFSKFTTFLENIKSYSVVTYSGLNALNTTLEERFCKVPYEEFSNLPEAYLWTQNLIKKSKKLTHINN